MKAEELRKKYRIMITGVAMAALLAGTAACSSQTSTGTAAGSPAGSTAAEAVEEDTDGTDGQNQTRDGATEEGTGTADEDTAGSDETGGNAADGGTAVSNTAGTDAEAGTGAADAAVDVTAGPAKEEIETTETLENSADGEHVITADGEEAAYANTAVTKTGDSDSGDEADFYGDNAAIFATNGGTLNLSEMVIETNGTHANGVFSYGEGTTVNISDSYIATSGNCSGGLMTTGGGTMNAENLTIETSGNSSAAIRSDRGGGTVNVTGGSYTTSGTGSPAIYSTADITVSNAELTSTASQGVVVEGKNSVTLNNVTLNADNNTKNSDKSDTYQAVMIYQSMSGDAAEGTAAFTMKGGTLTNANGDIFFVNNTATTIDLSDVTIINNDEDGVFLRAAAAGWGSEGSNGGHVNLTAADQEINGDMIVDEVSELNLYLKEESSFTGAINSDGAAGSVYVEIEDGSRWVLTGDSWIAGLTCSADAIDLNGYTLHVGDETYEAGTASTGEAIEFTLSSGNGGAPDGMPGEAPDGKPGQAPDGTPGEAPDGNAAGTGASENSGAPDGMSGQAPDGNPDEAPDGNGPQRGPGGHGKGGKPGQKPSGKPGNKTKSSSETSSSETNSSETGDSDTSSAESAAGNT